MPDVVANDFETVYRRTLEALMIDGRNVPPVQSPTSITSGFGVKPKASRELVGFTFRLNDPRRRELTNGVRGYHPVFARANFLWMLGQRDDHAWIERFNDKGAGLAEVDGHYPGAHGRRMGNQLQRVIDLLREDPTSRRAVISIYDREDLFTHSRDIPCVLELQLLRRNDRVECVTHMRSQNTVFVMPYDVFAFTMLQEVVAAALGIGVGPYTHQVSSLHMFEGDEEVVRQVLNTRLVESPSMGTMPAVLDVRELPVVLERELVRPGPGPGYRSPYPGYWAEFLSEMR